MKDPTGRVGRIIRTSALFAWLGVIGFGGPAAHVGLIRREVVERRGWIADEEFADLVGASSIVPGPTSTELVMHVGRLRAGIPGMLAAGAAFIAPAAVMVGLLAWGADVVAVAGVLDRVLSGVLPVVVAIVAHAGIGFGRRVLRGPTRVLTAVAALLGVVIGVHEIAVLAAAAVRGLLRAPRGRRPLGFGVFVPFGSLATIAAEAAPEVAIRRLAWSFVTIGATVFGSGYVVVSFLEREFVHRLGVATPDQVLAAVSAGQITPGPLFTAATHLGFQLAGPRGAVVATVAIFLPSFLLVGFLGPLARRVRSTPRAASALDHVNAASLGVLAAATLVLGRAGLTDVGDVAVSGVTFLLLWQRRLDSGLLVAGGALLGLLRTGIL